MASERLGAGNFSTDAGLNGGQEPSITGRMPEFRLLGGGIIKEANLAQDTPAVLKLYKSQHAIGHLADVMPCDTVGQLREYYQRHPGARLFVAELPNGTIAGAVTVLKEEDLRSAKLNRLVVAEEDQGKNIAHQLIRRALSYAFSREDAGGLGCEQVMLGVIQDIPGVERTTRAFERVGFDFLGPRLFKRCRSWDINLGGLVDRDVRQMLLQRRTYAMLYGRDLARGPEPNPHN